jgi:hypothetical protein
VRERYPTFADVLRDLDDALCMIAVFRNHAMMMSIKVQNDDWRTYTDISPQAKHVQTCERLYNEFSAYVVRTGALTKVFASIKVRQCWFVVVRWSRTTDRACTFKRPSWVRQSTGCSATMRVCARAMRVTRVCRVQTASVHTGVCR